MLTVRGLARSSDLELLCGARRAPTRRSAGSTSPSCDDPTPWLSGGELLLTHRPAAHDGARPARVRRAADRARSGRRRLRHRLRPRHASRRRSSRRPRRPACRSSRSPTTCRSSRSPSARSPRSSTSSSTRCSAATAVHRRLERLVLEERGLGEVVRGAGRRDRRRRWWCSTAAARRWPATPAATRSCRRRSSACATRSTSARSALGRSGEARDGIEIASEQPAGDVLVLPVATHGRGAPQAWLVAVPARDGDRRLRAADRPAGRRPSSRSS